MLLSYIYYGIPFFFVALMFCHHKAFGYITIKDTVILSVVSCVPILRECVLIALIDHIYRDSVGIGDIVLFGEKK